MPNKNVVLDQRFIANGSHLYFAPPVLLKRGPLKGKKMSSAIIEYLENKKLINNNEVLKNRIENASVIELIDISKEIFELTSADNITRNANVFTHSASISLSGGTNPCSNINCRLESVEHLSQFAALYSDCVYVKCFLSDYSDHKEHSIKEKPDILRKKFYDDMQILVALKPLIEANRVIPISTPINGCPICLSGSELFDDETKKNISSEYERLKNRYLNEGIAVLEKQGSWYGIRVKGPKDLYHDGFFGKRFPKNSKLIKDLEHLFPRINKGERIVLSSQEREKIGLDNQTAFEVIETVTFELALSQALGTSFLSERDVEVGVLKTIRGDELSLERDKIIQKHLTSIVPFVGDVNIADLIKLRQREEESFTLFRAALKKAIDEVILQKSTFTDRDANSIYGDIIEPKLSRLELNLKSAKKDLAIKTGVRTAAWVGAISFGIYSGFLPSGILDIAKVLGLTKIIAELVEMSMNIKGNEQKIRAEDMYFMWKLKKLSS